MRLLYFTLKTVCLATAKSIVNDSLYDFYTNISLNNGAFRPESFTNYSFIAGHLTNESSVINNSTGFESFSRESFKNLSSSANWITDRSLTDESLAINSSIHGLLTSESVSGETLTSESVSSETLTTESVSGETLTTESISGETLTTESVSGETLPTDSISSETLITESCGYSSFTNDSIPKELLPNGSSFVEKSCTVRNSTTANKPVSTVFNSHFSLESSIVSCLTFAIACVAVLNNSLLLWAIGRVDNSILKAKRFIQNMTVANLLLPVLIAFNPYFIATAVGGVGAQPGTCVLGVYSIARNMLGLSQPVCVLGLACDRIYAIARPMTYKLVGYTSLFRYVILFLPWFVGLTLLSIFMYVASNTLELHGIRNEPIVCHVFLSAASKSESSKVLDSVLISANVFSFLVYVSLFALYKYQQQNIHKISMTPVKKFTVSLVRTYFLLNVTTLALYLPAPIYALLNESALRETHESHNVITGLMIVYLLNTCLDPLICMSRIPSIRQNLPIKFKQVPARRGEKSSQRTEIEAHRR